MQQNYMAKLKGDSLWVISGPDTICDSLAFRPIEAGRFVVDDESGSLHCGRGDYLLIYSVSGDGNMTYDGRQVSLAEATLALIDSSRPYTLKCARHEDTWSFFWLRFNGRSCRYFEENLLIDGAAAFEAEHPDLVEREFEQALELVQQPGTDILLHISHSISELMTILLELKNAHSAKHIRHQQTIAQATEYIHNHYNEPLDIDQLANQANLSKYYFIKLFKEFMQIAPYEYIIIYRINEAKKYLRATTMKVSQISEAVGFNDECNFIRTFKRITGLTPLQYRDRQK